MSNGAIVAFEILAIIALCVVAYVAGSARLAQDDVLNLSWGLMLRSAYPALVIIAGVVSTIVLIKVSSEGLTK